MTSAAQNKATVLEAFDTLFNKRDYDKAAKFWSPNYIQHSAHIEPGRDGLFNLVKALPHTLRYENQLILAEGDMVMLHGRFSGNGGPAESDRCRYPAFGGRHPRRTLGCPAGRGHQCAVEERTADVRELLSCPTLAAVKKTAPGMPARGSEVVIDGPDCVDFERTYPLRLLGSPITCKPIG